MMRFGTCLALCVFLVLCAIDAHGTETRACTTNDVVTSYLKSNPVWSIVDLSDLSSDDRNLWQRYHQGLCPGMASGRLDSNHTWYALALLNRTKGKVQEKLILLKIDGQTVTTYLLSASQVIVEPFVVWRTGPGKYLDYRSEKQIVIRHDSFVYEKMESASVQFYLHNGRIHKLIAAY